MKLCKKLDALSWYDLAQDHSKWYDLCQATLSGRDAKGPTVATGSFACGYGRTFR